MDPITILLLVVCLLVGGVARRGLLNLQMGKKPKEDKWGYRIGYDPHYTRTKEIELFGHGITECDCNGCEQEKALLETRLRDELTKQSRPVVIPKGLGRYDEDYEYREAGGYVFFVPPWVPKEAMVEVRHEYRSGYSPGAQAFFSWYNSVTGQKCNYLSRSMTKASDLPLSRNRSVGESISRKTERLFRGEYDHLTMIDMEKLGIPYSVINHYITNKDEDVEFELIYDGAGNVIRTSGHPTKVKPVPGTIIALPNPTSSTGPR